MEKRAGSCPSHDSRSVVAGAAAAQSRKQIPPPSPMHCAHRQRGGWWRATRTARCRGVARAHVGDRQRHRLIVELTTIKARLSSPSYDRGSEAAGASAARRHHADTAEFLTTRRCRTFRSSRSAPVVVRGVDITDAGMPYIVEGGCDRSTSSTHARRRRPRHLPNLRRARYLRLARHSHRAD